MTAAAIIKATDFRITDNNPLHDLGFSYEIKVQSQVEKDFYCPLFTIKDGLLCIDPDIYQPVDEYDFGLLQFVLKVVFEPVSGAGVMKKYIHHAGTLNLALAKLCADGAIDLYWYWIEQALIAHKDNYVSFSDGEINLMKQVLSWKNNDSAAGYVYLVQSPTSFYKIGRTKNPDDRLKTFEVKLPFEVSYAAVIEACDMYTLEKTLHHIYDSKRVNGEWFNLSDTDVQYIKSLVEVR